jgi:hypothetical protein
MAPGFSLNENQAMIVLHHLILTKKKTKTKTDYKG